MEPKVMAWSVTSLFVAVALLQPIAGANGGLGGDVVVQVAAIEMETDNVASNDAEIEIERVYAAAAANCQVSVAVNSLAVHLVAVEQTALLEGLPFPFLPGPILGDGPRTASVNGGYAGPNATEWCEEDIGTMRVVIATADGWGEPAPLGNAASAAWENGIGGYGLGDTVVQVVAVGSEIGNVASNEADIEIEEAGAASASNCQFLAAANTVALNVALARQSAEIRDVLPEDDLGNGPVETFGEGNGRGGAPTALSWCRISVERFELWIGDVEHIPPAS